MKIVIIAGGKGTRIASINSEIPKAMIPINGKPVIEYQIELAKRYGYCDFIFIIGHLGKIIQRYFGDGAKWGISITYYQEITPLGTAGAIREISSLLNDNFFVFYGDTIMDIDLNKLYNFHLRHKADATLFIHPNNHPYDSDIVMINDKNQIINFYAKPHPLNFISKNLVNASLFVLSPKIIDYIPSNKKSYFEKDIFPQCIKNKLNLFGYVSFEYIKDMGTPDRYKSVCSDVKTGRIKTFNINNKRAAIFLDRDGVINKDVNLLCFPSQIELIKGVAEAIKIINHNGYLAIVITNQPVIAKNLCSIEELNIIHNTIETLLGQQHAYLNAIYYCPHHPDIGFPEERKEYKIKCKCRKPQPGLFFQAAQDWNIDLPNSYMIGDKESDIVAGINAGIKNNILIPTNTSNSLLSTIKNIFTKNNIQ